MPEWYSWRRLCKFHFANNHLFIFARSPPWIDKYENDKHLQAVVDVVLLPLTTSRGWILDVALIIIKHNSIICSFLPDCVQVLLSIPLPPSAARTAALLEDISIYLLHSIRSSIQPSIPFTLFSADSYEWCDYLNLIPSFRPIHFIHLFPRDRWCRKLLVLHCHWIGKVSRPWIIIPRALNLNNLWW